MTGPTSEDEQAAREAADWAARLNGRTVDTAELGAFYHWRRIPANAAAYARLEALWQQADALGSDRDVALMVQAALSRSTPAMRLRAILGRLHRDPASLVAALAALIAVLGVLAVLRPVSYRTGPGEQRLIRLDDGTRIHLNTDTALQVQYSVARRRIELAQGEAFFEVAHDAQRPFVVASNGSEVQAIGTRFDVRRDRRDVRVILSQGVVAVRFAGAGSGPAVTLQPGQAIWLGPSRPRTIDAVDSDALTSWTIGQLTFRDMPLRAAIAEVNRYLVEPITLDAADLADARVNGIFETGDRTAFVSAVTALFGLKARTTSDGGVVLTDHR